MEDWGDIENDENFPQYINRLGNFLILDSGINQHIKNHSIGYKIENDNDNDYMRSELKLVRQFIDMFSQWSEDNEWTFESISRRQDFLADNYALKVWNFEI